MLLIISFVLGLIVNFVGYLPFGNINLTVLQISINRGMRQVYYFLIPFTIFEVLFIFIIMKFVSILATESWMLSVLNWVMIPFFLIMALVTWFTRNKMPKEDYSRKDSVKLGVLFGIVNPMIIPFWVFAGTFMIKNQLISNDFISIVALSVGGAIGAFVALYLFAKFALYIQGKFTISSQFINKSIALLFFVLAIYQSGKQIYTYHKTSQIVEKLSH